MAGEKDQYGEERDRSLWAGTGECPGKRVHRSEEGKGGREEREVRSEGLAFALIPGIRSSSIFKDM